MTNSDYFIENLIKNLQTGQIRIPSFQRGFVWEPERVLYFIDSIYRGFPFGSILLWKTKNRLRTERNLGPYELPYHDPGYPIDIEYVLDGQQRITSIFGIFQNSLEPEKDEATNWTHLFFELNSEKQIPFKYLDDSINYDATKFFPLKNLLLKDQLPSDFVFDLDVDPIDAKKIGKQINDLYKKFISAKIPVERFESEEPSNVATVFERINKQGVALNTFQLLSVWNWSEDFDLQEKFKEIAEELEPYGFKEVDSD